MSNEAEFQRIHHRITDVEKSVEDAEERIDKRVDGLANDIDEHEKILRGNGEVGMRADVKRNTEFRKQIAKDIRNIFYLFLAQGIAVFIAATVWVIQNMK